jgi:hypothetical protein
VASPSASDTRGHVAPSLSNAFLTAAVQKKGNGNKAIRQQFKESIQTGTEQCTRQNPLHVKGMHAGNVSI